MCNVTANTAIFTLSLHDALPIFPLEGLVQEELDCLLARLQARPLHAAGEILQEDDARRSVGPPLEAVDLDRLAVQDRKSTRLNSSHGYISYAVFCLKKKKRNKQQ